jgi:hypothetical protein
MTWICFAVFLLNSVDAWPTISFVPAAAPYALVYEICDIKSLKDHELDAGDWGDGFYPAVRLNESLNFEKKITWLRVSEILSSQGCIRISHNPTNFSAGITTIQAELCDVNKECKSYIASPEAVIHIEQEPYSIYFLDAEVAKSSSTDAEGSSDHGGSECSPERISRLWPHPHNTTTSALGDTTLCDIIISYPRFPRYNCLESNTSSDVAPDTLLLYSFSHSDSWREDNLLFWLAQGLVFNGRYHFVVIVSGELKEGWRQLLDRIAAHSPTFEWQHMAHRVSDTCAWRTVLTGETAMRHRLRHFSRYLLLGAGCRGPFIPPYFADAWPEAFFTLLADGARVVGTAASCACEAPAQPTAGGGCAHLEGCAFAFGTNMLPIVLMELIDAQCAPPVVPDFTIPEEAAADALARRLRSMREFGRQLTRAAVAAAEVSGGGGGGGGGAAALEHRWVGVDLRDAAATAHVCADGEPAEAPHPLDVVFVDEGGRVARQDSLYQFTRMALGNGPWAVPVGVLCGPQMAHTSAVE